MEKAEPQSKISNDESIEADENGWIDHVDPDTQQIYYIHSESGIIT